MKNTILCLTTVLVLGGCASKYAVTFDSSPQGATLICNGTNWGYTPMTLYYDKSVKEQSTLNLGRCSANWVSGARKAYGVIPVTQYPDGVRQTLQRPNEPNAHIDHSFALQVQQNKQMNQVLKNQETMKSEQQRVKNEKQQEDNIQYLCNLGLLTYGCKN